MRLLIPALVACSFAVFACSGAQDAQSVGDSADQGSEQDLSAAKAQLKGSWLSSDKENAYDFSPNGEFFRDSPRVLDGMLVKGAPPPVARASGHYVVNTTKHQLTLHISSPEESTEVLSYSYTAGRILDGVLLPGASGSTAASLTLTEQPAPGSHVAYPSLKLGQVDSYCTASADCDTERGDGTWTPGFAGAGPVGPVVPPDSTCDQDTRTCYASLAK